MKPIPTTMTLRLVLVILVCGLTATAGSAQKKEKPRPNDPITCPYTAGDPERLAAAGLASLGGFAFGNADTAKVDDVLGVCDIRWIETAHFEIGYALGPYKVPQTERKKIRAELQELAKLLPEVDPRAKVLDPWLRTHLFAMRAEKTYARFLEIIGVQQSEFPPAPRQWLIGTPYMGEGPHVGQAGKFEILLLPSEADQVTFLRDQFGLRIKQTQRWMVHDTDSMIVVMHERQGSLRKDTALHCHVVFNLAANLVDAFRHYSYDTPPWLIEGLAHYLEREIDPRFNSFDASEGSTSAETKKSDWGDAVRKLVRTKKAPRLAELLQLRDFADFEVPHHFVSWSMTKYMVEEHPEAYGALTRALHGRMTEDGMPDGSDLVGCHRDALREYFGMSHAQFDEKWQEWVEQN